MIQNRIKFGSKISEQSPSGSSRHPGRESPVAMPVPEERLEFYCESQSHLKPPPPSLERMNDGQREDQGIIIHYSMRRFGPKPRGGRVKILLQFRLLEAYSYPKWSLGIQNPICFHWRGDKREVSRMDNYPLM